MIFRQQVVAPDKESCMKKLRVVLSVAGGIVILAVLFVMAINIGMGDIRKLVIKGVDLSHVADGVYDGSYHKGRWTYDVQVTVSNHRITTVRNTNKRMDAFESLNEEAAAE